MARSRRRGTKPFEARGGPLRFAERTMRYDALKEHLLAQSITQLQKENPS